MSSVIGTSVTFCEAAVRKLLQKLPIPSPADPASGGAELPPLVCSAMTPWAS